MIDIITNFSYKAIAAFLILLILMIVGRFLGSLIARMLYELGIDEIAESAGIKFFGSKSIGTLVSFIFYFLGIIAALNQIGMTAIVTTIAFILIAILIVVSTLLGAKDFIMNLFVGISLRKKYLNKSHLDIKGIKGEIIKVGRTKIKIKTQENEILFVPFMALKQSRAN